jgi:hypothetical protein
MACSLWDKNENPWTDFLEYGINKTKYKNLKNLCPENKI